MNQPPVNSYTVTLGQNVKVTSDKKSKSKIINFPFEFPDETKGVMVIIRLDRDEWIPTKDISNITIFFNDNTRK